LTEESLVSLKTVLINYDDDAYRPYDLGRVNIHHTTTPMRLNINLNDGYDPDTDQHSHKNSGQMEFYTRLHGSPKIWSSIQQISNLIELIHGPEKKHEIVFELDDGKTLVDENKSDFFDRFSEGGFEGTHQEDEPLRMKRGDKELAPNLETALFLSRCIEKPVAGFSNFDKNFPNLMKMLWVGESDQRIHQGRQTFNLEDDLPAMSYIHNKLSEFKGRNPKQNVELWKNWEQNLPSWELAEVLKIIEKKVRWPRVTYSHQMMHGDLRPSNVVVNAGREVWSENFMDVDYWYDLFLCDFPDLVAKQDNGELLYRRESVDGTPRVTSHFFNTMKPPKINPMLDLSRFFAYLLVQVPFEPSKQEKGMLAIEKRNRRTRARESRKEDDIHARVRQQLERALVWAERELRDLCFLAEEGTEDTWRELLKAMIFDQCLQIMMHWKRDRSGPAIEGDLGPEDLCWIFYNVSTPQPVYAPTFLDKVRLAGTSEKIAASRKAPKNNDDNLVYLSATENRVKMNAGWEVNHVHPKQAKQYNQPVPERYPEKPWNKEVVKLSFSDWELNLDPESTTLLGLDAAQTELPGLLADAMENGFPANSLHHEGDHEGYIRFMDEYSDDYAWECRWKIKDDVFTVLWILEA